MPYPDLRISGSPGPAHPFRGDAAEGPDRPLSELVQELETAQRAGEQLVILWGHDPLHHHALPALLRAARERGLAPSLRGPASTFDPSSLADLDVEILWLPLHGDPATHDRVTEAQGDCEALRTWLTRPSRPRIRTWSRVSAETVDQLGAAALLAAPHAEQLVLHRHDPAPSHAALRAALEAVWEAHPADLLLEGLSAPPDAAVGPSRPFDEQLLRLRVQGGWLPGLFGGTHGAPPQLDAARFALGLGGPAPAHPSRPLEGPVAVIVPAVGDTLLATSTLPGLCHHLAQRGVDVRLHTVWDAPWNLYGPAAFDPNAPALPPSPESDPSRSLRRIRSAQELGPAFLEHLDLRGIRTVIVPGWEAGLVVLRHPTRAPDCRVILLDLHLLHGVSAWTDAFLPSGAKAVDGGWFPDADVEVWSCFPGYAANYLQRGVPLSRLRWRPYPIFSGHLPPGGDVLACTHLATAGNHRRDHDLLLATCARLPADLPPIVLHSSSSPPAVGPLQPRGHVSLLELHRTVATARLLLLPLQWSPHDAAGITLAAMALSAGRPVVASRTWAMVDHVQEGLAGLLVEPDDAGALADALTLLARDEALLGRLAKGAAASGVALGVAALAEELIEGRPAPWPARPRTG